MMLTTSPAQASGRKANRVVTLSVKCASADLELGLQSRPTLTLKLRSLPAAAAVQTRAFTSL
jgi:D-arabinose 5-phosphate isomerase GutQ